MNFGLTRSNAGAEVASDLSPDTIATTTALLRSTYRTEAQLATSLVRQREAELATLRLAGRELLQTRVRSYCALEGYNPFADSLFAG